MLGVAGILIPGLLTKIGILNVPEWYDAGLVSQQNSSIPFSEQGLWWEKGMSSDSGAVHPSRASSQGMMPVCNLLPPSPQPTEPLLLIELFAFNFVELKRLKDIQKPGSQGEPGSFLGEAAAVGRGSVLDGHQSQGCLAHFPASSHSAPCFIPCAPT